MIISIFLIIVIVIVIVIYMQTYYDKKSSYAKLQLELKQVKKDLTMSLLDLEKKDFYLKTIQNVSGIGVWEIYADKAKIPYWSDELYYMLEKNKETFKPTYKNFKKLLSKEKRKIFIDEYESTLQRKSNFFINLDSINDSGKLKIESRAYHNYSELGEYISTFGVIINVSEKHQLENRLKNINKHLDDKINEEVIKNKIQQEKLFKHSRMAQMGEMISMIAHQWRQPLGAISSTSIDLQMQLELDTFHIQEKDKTNPCQTYFLSELKIIDQLVQNLTTTIDDFRNFYKPNKNKYNGLISESIIKALYIMKAALKSTGVEIIEDYRSDNKLDHYLNELMQVVLNILKNAQDNFLEKHTKKPRIILSTFDTSLSTVINIIDNGGGIPEDIIEKIFDPYFSTKDEKNGTGLGLYMSKIIINEHHGGDLYVANYNDGVRFTIELQKDLIL